MFAAGMEMTPLPLIVPLMVTSTFGWKPGATSLSSAETG